MSDSVHLSRVAGLATICRRAYVREPLNGTLSSRYEYFVVTAANSRALVAWDDHEVVIAIAGTDQPDDWGDNFDSGQRPLAGSSWRAHRGFLAHANDLWREMGPRLDDLMTDRELIITGHSLGGATAVLIAFWIQQLGHRVADIVTFGAPRVFDYRGAAMSRLPMLRVCNAGDPVPHLPTFWRFAHFGDKWYVTERGHVWAGDPMAFFKSIWWTVRRLVSGSCAFFAAHSIETYEERLKRAAEVAREAELDPFEF